MSADMALLASKLTGSIGISGIGFFSLLVIFSALHDAYYGTVKFHRVILYFLTTVVVLHIPAFTAATIFYIWVK